jgi:hypothetical protein
MEATPLIQKKKTDERQNKSRAIPLGFIHQFLGVLIFQEASAPAKG